MSSIAEATPAAKASPRSCREASASTNSRRAAGLVMDTLTANYECGEVHAWDLLGHLAQPRGVHFAHRGKVRRAQGSGDYIHLFDHPRYREYVGGADESEIESRLNLQN